MSLQRPVGSGVYENATLTWRKNDITKLSVRQSFTRALAEAEQIDLMYLRWATAHSELSGDTNRRDVTCVVKSGMDAKLTDDDWGEARMRCFDVFAPERGKALRFMRGAAELQRQIDEGAEA
jgi:hypothetical protein